MLDYTTLNLIIGSDKPHPEYHCDVPEGEKFLYGEPSKTCQLGDKCIRRNGTYHHSCAESVGIAHNYVCECGRCKPQYSFYYNGIRRDTICPWCAEHCQE